MRSDQSMQSILIADDNIQIAEILEQYAHHDGYRTYRAKDGEEALAVLKAHQPSIVLLDVMMPKMDGFAVCKEIRRISSTPVIMITARGEDFERIMGLDIGADDYIVKPFSPSEVMARVRAVLRRIEPENEEGCEEATYGSLTVNLSTYTTKIAEQPITLTKKEIELLWLLMTNKGKVFSRTDLLQRLWGYDYFGDTRTVDSHVKRLRAKTDAVKHEDWEIKTVWGVGYKFEGFQNGEE